MAALSRWVHVVGPDGAVHAFGPGDDVPAWAVTAITNPNVWADPPVASVEDSAPIDPPPGKRPARRRPASS